MSGLAQDTKNINLVILPEHIPLYNVKESIQACEYVTENRIRFVKNYTNNQSGYLCINTREYTLDTFTKEIDDGSKFSQQFKLICKNTNIHFIFINLHESELDENIIIFLEKLFSLGVSSDRITIANNDVDISKFNKFGINTHRTHMIEKTYGGGYKELPIQFNENKNGKKFLCLNNIKREHRVALLTLLEKENLLNNINYSLVGSDYFPLTNNVLNDETIKSYNSTITKFHEKMYYTDFELNKSQNFFYTICVDDFLNSFVNIITETFYLENKVHISEKSLKPFWFYQLPIFVASTGHVSKVKEKYNFDLFDDIIDHSYDTITNSVKRLEAIVEEIKRVNNLDLKNIYKNNKDRFISNRLKCESYLDSNEDYLFFKQIFI
jgi:hypothetical protein